MQQAAPKLARTLLSLSLAWLVAWGYWLAWCEFLIVVRGVLSTGEVDVSLLHVGADEFDFEFIANVEALLSLRQHTFDVSL